MYLTGPLQMAGQLRLKKHLRRSAPDSCQGKALLSPHLQQQLQLEVAGPTSSFHRNSKLVYVQNPRFLYSSFLTTFDLMNQFVSALSAEFSLSGLF